MGCVMCDAFVMPSSVRDRHPQGVCNIALVGAIQCCHNARYRFSCRGVGVTRWGERTDRQVAAAHRCRFALAVTGVLLPVFWCTSSLAQSTTQTVLERPVIVVQSTTSTANSGLYDHLMPMLTEATGVQPKIVALGTGQAIRNARNCDADVLLVHAKSAEQMFVREGYGVARHDLMYNDFILIGPRDDPAGVSAETDLMEALKKIAATKSIFASRGDDSGTHKKELSLWEDTGTDVAVASGGWYRETGSGMGATLNVGIGMDAYVLTDRATWISFSNKREHRIVFEGDGQLFNQYGIILVNPEQCPDVNVEAGQRFVDWLLSSEGQTAIASHTVDDQQLFFPNAKQAQ